MASLCGFDARVEFTCPGGTLPQMHVMQRARSVVDSSMPVTAGQLRELVNFAQRHGFGTVLLGDGARCCGGEANVALPDGTVVATFRW